MSLTGRFEHPADAGADLGRYVEGRADGFDEGRRAAYRERRFWLPFLVVAAGAFLAGVLIGGPCTDGAAAGGREALISYYDASYAQGCVASSPHPRCDHPYWGSAAASYDIPFGTLIDVGGHVVVVTDRGGGLGDGSAYTHVDVYCPWDAATCDALFSWGVRPVTILRWGFGE